MSIPAITLYEFQTAPPSRAEAIGVETYLPFCLKVRRALNWLQLPYRVERLAGPAQIKRFNPLGQAPALTLGEQAFGDSTLIIERVSAVASRPLDHGLSASEAAEALLWEELADTTLNGFLAAARWADDDNWPNTRAAVFGTMPKLVAALVLPKLRATVMRRLIARDIWRAGPDACWQRFEKLLDQLDSRAPTTNYWIGSCLTVADLALFAQLRSLQCGLTGRQARSLERRSRLSEYLSRVDDATQRSTLIET